MRIAKITRNTSETQIKIKFNIDGTGRVKVICPINFLKHILETFATHGIFNLEATINGNINIDQHHLIEDTGIALGSVIKNALGDKRGINRVGFSIYPMDETLGMVAIDLSNRPYLRLEVKFKNKRLGDLSTDLLEDFFNGFVNSLGATLHIRVYYGRSDHHKVEAIFKALGIALKNACEIEERIKGKIPSTKGIL